MRWIGAVAAVALIAAALFDAFKAVILPRRVSFGYLVRFFYRSAWKVWRARTDRLGRGGSDVGRVGALGGRAAGEPHLLPRPRLLSVATREPVVDRGGHDDPRHVRAVDRRRRRSGPASGAADVCDGPARG